MTIAINAQLTIPVGDKRYRIPAVMHFPGAFRTGSGLALPHRVVFVRYGKPRAGEYYVSGAIPEVYLAASDLTSDYIIVEPGAEMTRVASWAEVRA